MQNSQADEIVSESVHVNILLVPPSWNVVSGSQSRAALVPTANRFPAAGLDDPICPALSVWESGTTHTEKHCNQIIYSSVYNNVQKSL